MSEYNYNNRDMSEKNRAEDGSNAFYSTNSVSGTGSSDSVDFTRDIDVQTSYGANETDYDAIKQSIMDATPNFGAPSNSVTTVGAYNSLGEQGSFNAETGMSAAGNAQSMDFTNNLGAGGSYSLSDSSALNCGETCGTCRSLQGVQCEATNCRYHHPGGQCSASSIVVEAPNADNKTETFCNTFTPNTGY